MGITRLNEVLGSECASVFDVVLASAFAGEYVAVDFSIILHQAFNMAYKTIAININIVDNDPDEATVLQRTAKTVLDKISREFIRRGIKPIFVLDGTMPELKTQVTAPKRRAVRESARVRLEDTLASFKGKALGSYEYDKIAELKCQSKGMPKELYPFVIEKVKSKGYPFLTATNEAEELCAKLCIDGKVKAVYSTDTDNIVRKCPILITKFEWGADGLESDKAHIVRYSDEIPRSLGLNYASFLDFCILMGCDYNERPKGAKMRDIQEHLYYYKTIEGLESGEGITLDSTNYKKCRELLSERSVNVCCQTLDEVDRLFPNYAL